MGKAKKPEIIRAFKWSDAGGKIAYHLRMNQTNNQDPKFQWNTEPDGSGVWKLSPCQPDLYQRDAVIAASVVIACAGERDVETTNNWLRELGLHGDWVATCNHTGENSVRAESFQILQGKEKVFVVGDNDATGEMYRKKVLKILPGTVKHRYWLQCPFQYNDLTEWQQGGGTALDFKVLLDSAKSVAPGSPKAPFIAGRRMELVRGDTIKSERTNWVWEGRIPYKAITLLCGDPDVGKSMTAMDLAAQMSAGKCPGVFTGKPVDVLIASAEDSPVHTLVPRLRAAGADLTKVHMIKLKVGEEDAGGLNLPDDIPLLAAEAKKVKAKVLIIDPLMSHLGEGLNANQDQDIRKALGPLPALAEAEDLTILIICHLNKNEAAAPKYRIGGSVGIFAVPRSVLLAAKHPENEGEYVLVHLKCNVGDKAVPLRFVMEPKLIEDDEGTSIETGGIVWMGEADGVTAASALNGRKDSKTPSLCDEVRVWLAKYLGDGPRVQKAVVAQAKIIGYSEATVRRAREALGIKSEKAGFGRDSEWTWTLPDKGIQAVPKDAHVQGAERLCKKIGENSQKHQLIPKDAQTHRDEHLSESETVEAGHPVGVEDVGHPLLLNSDEVDPWN